MEKIEMAKARQGVGQAIHYETGGEEVDVEDLAVIGNEELPFPGQFLERRQAACS